MRRTKMLPCAGLIFAAWLLAGAPAHAQGSVDRGRYLVEAVLTCGNCHSPRGPGGVVDSAKLYSGGPQTWDEPSYTVKGANITPDPETGIGKWNVTELKRAMVDGVRPNGSHLAPIMPINLARIAPVDSGDPPLHHGLLPEVGEVAGNEGDQRTACPRPRRRCVPPARSGSRTSSAISAFGASGRSCSDAARPLE